ncbi:unnamed protein product [Sphenostylis stenocarpa]|uniref:Non-structural maintenance of chromosomes element 1 homolog n=1 Tax=Sphenostylis stenocarpa TaxID=92480 RepID=A0AA86TGB6_9FABA|nr:unnamed protein product [Sphenostylis stenocarpa]
MASALSWRHHVMIQALLSRGPLSEKDLYAMFEDLTKKNPGIERQLFDGFILKINKALSCADFELRACIDQYDGQVYYGVVNTVSDEHSKLGTKYSVPQIAFYKAIIEAIVQDASANGVIFSIHALNLSLDSQSLLIIHINKDYAIWKMLALRHYFLFLVLKPNKNGTIIGSKTEAFLKTGGLGSISVLLLFDLQSIIPQVTIVTDAQSQGGQPNVPSALKNFSLSQKEKTLHELVRDQWLNLTTDGVIKLGLKSFLDLRSWFRNNEVPSCHVCNEAGIKIVLVILTTIAALFESDNSFANVWQAEVCQNENCTVRIHQYCLKQLFLQRKAAKVCPNCGTSWPCTVPKEEAFLIEDNNGPRENQRMTRSDRKRKSANRVVVDDEVGCSNQDELNENRETQNDNVLVRKRRVCQTDDADIGGSGKSQSSGAIPVLRRRQYLYEEYGNIMLSTYVLNKIPDSGE